MTYDRIKKSIIDHRPGNLTRKLHEAVDVINEQKRELSMIWDILSALDVAVCDYCHEEWFFCKHPGGFGPCGDARGLLVWGGACCAKCLDKMYDETQQIADDEELESIYQDIAHWLLRHRGHMNSTVWATDPIVKRIMQIILARS